jgi:mRNA interferase RelE/StbE
MKVQFMESFLIDLDAVTHVTVKKQIIELIDELELSRDLRDHAHFRELPGEGFYRLKIGDYRLGCQLENDVLIFSRIVHKKFIS